MKKIILSMVGILLAVNLFALASAVDVAYLVTAPGSIKTEFVNALGDLGYTYEVVYYNQVSTYDFSEVKFMIINNDYFPNWADIPVNDYPALIVNGRHIDEWGWARTITSSSQSVPMHINLNTSHEITGALGGNIQIYTSSTPDVYYLDKTDIFSGLTIVGSNTYDAQDGIVVVGTAGSVLSKPGYTSTNLNADSVFFGITETAYWTANTRQLFKNSLEWLYNGAGSTFDIDLASGVNLISLPINPTSNDVSEIFSSNPEVVSVKKYLSGAVAETSTMYNNQGYFVEALSASTLTVQGNEISEMQNVELSRGMNLVGISSLTNIDLDSLPPEVIEVSRRNVDGSYDVSTKYFFGWYNEFPLEPGVGYWFKTSQEIIWSYNPI